MHSWCPTEASCPGKSCYSVHVTEIHRQFKLKLGNNSHVPQVLWDWDWDLVEGVPRRRTVGIEGSDAVSCDYLVVRGVARRIFDHVELEGDIREKHAHTWARSRWWLLNSHLIVSLFEQHKCFKIMILKHFFFYHYHHLWKTGPAALSSTFIPQQDAKTDCNVWTKGIIERMKERERDDQN